MRCTVVLLEWRIFGWRSLGSVDKWQRWKESICTLIWKSLRCIVWLLGLDLLTRLTFYVYCFTKTTCFFPLTNTWNFKEWFSSVLENSQTIFLEKTLLYIILSLFLEFVISCFMSGNHFFPVPLPPPFLLTLYFLSRSSLHLCF